MPPDATSARSADRATVSTGPTWPNRVSAALALLGIPQLHGLVDRARDGEPPVRRQIERRHGKVVAVQDRELAAVRGAPDLDAAVRVAGEDFFAVRRELHRIDVVAGRKLQDLRAGLQVPDAYRAIPAGRCGAPPVGRGRDRRDLAAVAGKACRAPLAREVPDRERAVVAGRDRPVARQEGDVVDRGVVAVEVGQRRSRLQIPEDHAVVEARGQRPPAIGRDRDAFDRPAVLVEGGLCDRLGHGRRHDGTERRQSDEPCEAFALHGEPISAGCDGGFPDRRSRSRLVSWRSRGRAHPCAAPPVAVRAGCRWRRRTAGSRPATRRSGCLAGSSR